MVQRLIEWIKVNIKDLSLGVIGNLLVALAIWYLGSSFLPGTNFEKAVLILLFTIFLLLAILLPFLFTFFNKRLKTDDLLKEIHGSTWRNSQYYQRKNHYSEEKHKIAKEFMQKHLPFLIEKFFKEFTQEASDDKKNEIVKINLIIDSGSTLAPLFKYLSNFKINKKLKEKLKIFTNNIAGIEELHRSKLDESSFEEIDFYLIGGNPLQKYLATTIPDYESTKRNLERLLLSENVVNISIVTSNWVLGGDNLQELTLCAKGRGHHEFKKALIELSDYVIVITPLGKILKLGKTSDLNAITEGEEDYKPINFPQKKDKIYLFTSFRRDESLSPLKDHSVNLKRRIMDPFYSIGMKYTFLTPISNYEPIGNQKEVFLEELPHDYISEKEKFSKAYGYSKPNS